MRYEILDQSGNVIKGIIADQAFVDEHYPGMARAVEESVVVEAKPVVMTVEEKVDRLIAALEKKGVIDVIAKD